MSGLSSFNLTFIVEIVHLFSNSGYISRCLCVSMFAFEIRNCGGSYTYIEGDGSFKCQKRSYIIHVTLTARSRSQHRSNPLKQRQIRQCGQYLVDVWYWMSPNIQAPFHDLDLKWRSQERSNLQKQRQFQQFGQYFAYVWHWISANFRSDIISFYDISGLASQRVKIFSSRLPWYCKNNSSAYLCGNIERVLLLKHREQYPWNTI